MSIVIKEIVVRTKVEKRFIDRRGYRGVGEKVETGITG